MIRMEVTSTVFFIVNCAIIGSSRSENSSIIRYWTNATRLASIPIIPSSRALSQASEMGRRVESRAMMPPRTAMAESRSARSPAGASRRFIDCQTTYPPMPMSSSDRPSVSPRL